MKVRVGSEGNLERVLEIEGESFKYPWPREAFERYLGNSVFLICEKEGEILGFLIATVGALPRGKGGVAHIQNLAVNPNHRRKGVASRLLKELFEICKKLHIENLRLEVRVNNYGAIKFYERHGFQKKRSLRFFYENDDNAYLMQRKG